MKRLPRERHRVNFGLNHRVEKTLERAIVLSLVDPKRMLIIKKWRIIDGAATLAYDARSYTRK